MLTESTGFSRTNQLIVSPNVNYKKHIPVRLLLFSLRQDGRRGPPADPYNSARRVGTLRRLPTCGTAPWSGTNVPHAVEAQHQPVCDDQQRVRHYNITTGRDTEWRRLHERASCAGGGRRARASCGGGNLVYEAGFRLLQPESRGGQRHHRPQLRARTGQSHLEHARCRGPGRFGNQAANRDLDQRWTASRRMGGGAWSGGGGSAPGWRVVHLRGDGRTWWWSGPGRRRSWWAGPAGCSAARAARNTT